MCGLVDDPCSSVVIAPLDTLGWDGVDGEGRKDTIGKDISGNTHVCTRDSNNFLPTHPALEDLIPKLHNLLGRGGVGGNVGWVGTVMQLVSGQGV